MSRRVRVLAATACAAVGMGVLALPAPAADQVVSRGVTIPAFYTPPAQLPAADGALVRHEPLKLAVSLPGISGPLPGRATRIMYKSTDNAGEPVAVTGAYIEPSAAWRGKGPRPLVVVAPGTMGQGDQCSTSLGLQHAVLLGNGTMSVGYEILSIYQLLLKGIAVVQTDYVGLGATDRLHTYVDRVDEAHAVLDAARAVRSLPGVSVKRSSPVGFYGYSQGGGAVAAAAELQATYAPDVPLKATYAGAPPADLAEVAKGIDGSELAGALGWSVNGFVQSDPALGRLLDGYLNDAGRAALKDLSTMCVGDALFAYAYKKSSSWTTGGQTISEIAKAEPAFQAIFTEQRIGTRKPTGVVRLATGVNDNLVPHGQARQLGVDWCKRGAKVVYEAVPLPKTASPLINHFGPLITDQAQAVGWLADRMAGKSAVSTCAKLR